MLNEAFFSISIGNFFSFLSKHFETNLRAQLCAIVQPSSQKLERILMGMCDPSTSCSISQVRSNIKMANREEDCSGEICRW